MIFAPVVLSKLSVSCITMYLILRFVPGLAFVLLSISSVCTGTPKTSVGKLDFSVISVISATVISFSFLLFS